MILKGIYSTAVDRLPMDDYIRWMFHTFSIIIEEPAQYGHYTGFIKRNAMYDCYFPFVKDGHIGSLLHHDMRRYSGSSTTDLKQKIKRMMCEDPERFIELAEATKRGHEEWKRKKLQSAKEG